MAILPTHFYCQSCDRFTRRRDYSDDEIETLADGGEVNPVCGPCHEPYQCGECGYEIDQHGNCLREEGHDA